GSRCRRNAACRWPISSRWTVPLPKVPGPAPQTEQGRTIPQNAVPLSGRSARSVFGFLVLGLRFGSYDTIPSGTTRPGAIPGGAERGVGSAGPSSGLVHFLLPNLLELHPLPCGPLGEVALVAPFPGGAGERLRPWGGRRPFGHRVITVESAV